MILVWSHARKKLVWPFLCNSVDNFSLMVNKKKNHSHTNNTAHLVSDFMNYMFSVSIRKFKIMEIHEWRTLLLNKSVRKQITIQFKLIVIRIQVYLCKLFLKKFQELKSKIIEQILTRNNKKRSTHIVDFLPSQCFQPPSDTMP